MKTRSKQDACVRELKWRCVLSRPQYRSGYRCENQTTCDSLSLSHRVRESLQIIGRLEMIKNCAETKRSDYIKLSHVQRKAGGVGAGSELNIRWSGRKSLESVGKRMGLLRLMDIHDHDRALTILYATESGGAQDAANKVARRCRDLNFECRNINVRDYPLVSFLPVHRRFGRNRTRYQITHVCSQTLSTRPL